MKKEMTMKKTPLLMKGKPHFISICLILLLILPALYLSCSRCTLGNITIGGADNTERGRSDRITILSYNVENLFDAVDNGTEYWDYDPGQGTWDEDLYYGKMLCIAEVIGTAVGRGADIVALQEIENASVLETLRTEGVKNLGYRYSALIEAPDSAVNTGILSRYPIEKVLAHSLKVPEGDRLRHLLEVEIKIGDNLLVLFNNHWKSKSGGAEETEFLRIAAAELLERRILAILETNPAADIVVCGDLNENHDEYTRIERAYSTALLPVEQPSANMNGNNIDAPGVYITGDIDLMSGVRFPIVLYSPWFSYVLENQSKTAGSYRYDGRWETIDHFLLSAGLFDEIGFRYNGFQVIAEDFMVNDEGAPLRWSADFMKGYSDHLPILLDLEMLK